MSKRNWLSETDLDKLTKSNLFWGTDLKEIYSEKLSEAEYGQVNLVNVRNYHHKLSSPGGLHQMTTVRLWVVPILG